jgi:hypothetical protein
MNWRRAALDSLINFKKDSLENAPRAHPPLQFSESNRCLSVQGRGSVQSVRQPTAVSVGRLYRTSASTYVHLPPPSGVRGGPWSLREFACWCANTRMAAPSPANATVCTPSRPHIPSRVSALSTRMPPPVGPREEQHPPSMPRRNARRIHSKAAHVNKGASRHDNDDAVAGCRCPGRRRERSPSPAAGTARRSFPPTSPPNARAVVSPINACAVAARRKGRSDLGLASARGRTPRKERGDEGENNIPRPVEGPRREDPGSTNVPRARGSRPSKVYIDLERRGGRPPPSEHGTSCAASGTGRD